MTRLHGAAALLLLTIAVVAGCAKTPPAGEETGSTTTTTTETPAPPAAGGEARVVAVTVDGKGFHPDRIEATAGEPLKLVLTRTTDETCGTEIVMPAFAVNQKLPLNEPVEVVVTPTEPGTIAFACGMDMYKGTIVVQ